MTPRDDQLRVIEGARRARREGASRILCVMPTGGGKSCTASVMAAVHVAHGGRVVWLAHRAELVDQAVATLARFGVEAGARGKDATRAVQVVSPQQLLASEEAPPATLVIADEAHHFVEGNDWHRVLMAYRGKPILGLTATPERGDGRGLGGDDGFEAMIVGASVSELQRFGVLVECVCVRPGGRVRSKRIAVEPVDAYLTHAAGSLAVVFAPHVKAAWDYADGFRAHGIPFAVVTGDMKPDDRERALAGFGTKHRVLLNVAVLTEGWDRPDLETVIVARRIGSTTLFLQIGGRALRASPGKSHGTMLDLTGVFETHGSPNEDRVYSLHGHGIMRRGVAAGARFCQVCGALLEEDPPCQVCGSMKELETPRAQGVKLERFDWRALKARDDEEKRLAFLAKKIHFARVRRYAAGWPRVQYHACYGRWPSNVMMRAAEKLANERRSA